ncbi:hypothetical protein CC80DRAFT_110428 [Byssothecium circinans]|uniref:Uncharacterized protein n=1 Tax=Byssothecium circinans TaxID=147558 RepID=A0A6A5TSN5_9PLEO|nr:hypothetical protein CC80DRAFT_110428 [Byssothecium circinans]
MKPASFLCAAISLATPIAASGGNTSTPNFGYEELYRLQHAFYEKFIFPNNIAEAQSINSTVFSENVQGRVSDTRNFVGRELNTEYIFGLFTPNNLTTIIGLPVGPYKILQFTGNQNIASASTRMYLQFPSFKNATLPIMIDTWMTWNAAREITQYDVTFRWFGFLLQTLLASVDPDPIRAHAIAKDMLAKSICRTHQSYCAGTADQQYASNEECYHFLTEEIRVGDSFELGMDTLLCRNVHEIMVGFRPGVHCSHIGRDGGGQCADEYSYREKVEEEVFSNSPWRAPPLK